MELRPGHSAPEDLPALSGEPIRRKRLMVQHWRQRGSCSPPTSSSYFGTLADSRQHPEPAQLTGLQTTRTRGRSHGVSTQPNHHLKSNHNLKSGPILGAGRESHATVVLFILKGFGDLFSDGAGGCGPVRGRTAPGCCDDLTLLPVTACSKS